MLKPTRPRYRRSAARALLLCAVGAAWPLAAQQRFDVGMRDGLLTIRANAAPAEELALAISEATGIDIIIAGEPATPLSAEIVDEPVIKAIALLAPNHLLVRESAAADAALIEAVLMMPDGSGGSASTEFLPSGAPAEEVAFDAEPAEVDENGMPIDPAALRDPNRGEARQAVGDDGTQPLGSGPTEDPLIDPQTGATQ